MKWKLFSSGNPCKKQINEKPEGTELSDDEKALLVLVDGPKSDNPFEGEYDRRSDTRE